MAIFLIFSFLSLMVCPAVYIALCLRMRKANVASPPYVPFFFLFGTLGGWFMALALSPSGLTATCFILLVTLAPIAVIGSSIYLAARSQRSSYHRLALWSGFSYPALLLLWILVIVIVEDHAN
jgi:hypothetical protein